MPMLALTMSGRNPAGPDFRQNRRFRFHDPMSSFVRSGGWMKIASKRAMFAMAALISAFACAPLSAQQAPTIEGFPGGDGESLQARVFVPAAAVSRPRAAIVLFHGGGWSEGEAAWMDATANLMAQAGLVAIAVDYRLSGQGGATPYDAVADARAAVRWVRHDAQRLGVDPKRIAAGGTSAGGHLAASAAVFDEPWGDPVSARPDALVLWSPALSPGGDAWFGKLVGGRARARALSPDLHVRSGMPPAIVLQGAEDSVTPAAGARRFCERMRQMGNRCELAVYPGVGHLFTRNLGQQEIPDYKAIDLKIDADADRKAVAFLKGIGFAPP